MILRARWWSRSNLCDLLIIIYNVSEFPEARLVYNPSSDPVRWFRAHNELSWLTLHSGSGISFETIKSVMIDPVRWFRARDPSGDTTGILSSCHDWPFTVVPGLVFNWSAMIDPVRWFWAHILRAAMIDPSRWFRDLRTAPTIAVPNFQTSGKTPLY